MREILFRGKKRDNGEWAYGDLCQVLPGCECKFNLIFSQDECATSSIVLPETVGQFTGLTDKNGKKIFEGDIVVVPLSGKSAKGIIKYFKTDICGFTVITQPQYSNYVLQKNCAYEVIGNIYDDNLEELANGR